MGACRDCKNCTNSALVHNARKLGRIYLGLASVGASEIAMGLRKKCRECGHQMSLHGIEQVFGVPQPLVESASDPGPRMRGWMSPRYVQPPGSTNDQAPPPPVSEAPPRTSPPASSIADELIKLAQLRDAGVLTSDEFEAQKAKLLG